MSGFIYFFYFFFLLMQYILRSLKFSAGMSSPACDDLQPTSSGGYKDVFPPLENAASAATGACACSVMWSSWLSNGSIVDRAGPSYNESKSSEGQGLFEMQQFSLSLNITRAVCVQASHKCPAKFNLTLLRVGRIKLAGCSTSSLWGFKKMNTFGDVYFSRI